jgi:hypothetical protein
MRNSVMVALLSSALMGAFPAPQPDNAKLRSVQIKRPNVFIRGTYLSKVEVWAVPTGTGITPEQFVLLGNARRTTSTGVEELWSFPIPPCETDTRLLATEVFVKGFNGKGDVAGTKSLPYSGATAVHGALCGKH